MPRRSAAATERGQGIHGRAEEASGDRPINTGEYAQDLGATGADQASKTEDFARSNSEGDIGDDP